MAGRESGIDEHECPRAPESFGDQWRKGAEPAVGDKDGRRPVVRDRVGSRRDHRTGVPSESCVTEVGDHDVMSCYIQRIRKPPPCRRPDERAVEEREPHVNQRASPTADPVAGSGPDISTAEARMGDGALEDPSGWTLVWSDEFDGAAGSRVDAATWRPEVGGLFDHEFFLLLNLAVGGTFSVTPDSSVAFPQAMLVDYIRVYGH
jgi:hypothetical protein